MRGSTHTSRPAGSGRAERVDRRRREGAGRWSSSAYEQAGEARALNEPPVETGD